MPTLQVLDQAMARPSTSLPILGRLGGGQIALVGGQQPWRAVGLDAAVYALRQPTGRTLALRVPLADGENRALGDRYRALGADPRLAALKDAPGSPVAPRVAYYPDGLLLPARDLRSTPHPVIVLDWIEGPSLIAAVDRSCRAGDGAALAALAHAWLRTMGLLTAHGFVHGDLAGDNVLVRPGGTLALVDYDTAVWPGGPAPATARINPAYGHPSGMRHPSLGRGDDFAALVIYASLRALAERPELRPQFGDPTSEPGGALLWRPWDLANPGSSPVFAALADPSPDLETILRALRQACVAPVDRVPRLGEIVADAGANAAAPPSSAHSPAPPPDWQGSAATASMVPPPAAAVPRHPAEARPGRVSGSTSQGEAARGRQALLTRLNGFLMSGDDEGAIALWQGSGLARDPETVRDYGPRIRAVEERRAAGQVRAAAAAKDSVAVLRLWRETGLEGSAAAREVQPAVEAARRRIAQAERLRLALDAGDRETVGALWPELRGDPLVAMDAVRVSEMLGRGLTESVNLAVERRDDRAILTALAEAEAASVPIEAGVLRAGRAATKRDATRRALAAAVRDGNEGILAELALSGKLDELGRLDVATTQAVLRALHRPALTDALASDDDWAIAAVYDAQGGLYDETGLHEKDRSRVELAKARLAWLTDVRTALRNRDIATLKAVTRASPPGAAARLSETERNRIERLSRRDVAVRRLERLLKEGDDREILDALARMKESGASFPPGFDWATLRAVEERTELADGIVAALNANPPDLERLAALLPAAKAAAEAGNPPIIPGTDLAQVERDVLRAAQIARVRDAIASGDDQTILAVVMPDQGEILAALTAEERERIRRAVTAARSAV